MGAKKPTQRPSDDQLLHELEREFTAALAIGVVHSENTEAKFDRVRPSERNRIVERVEAHVGVRDVPIERPKREAPLPEIKKRGG